MTMAAPTASSVLCSLHALPASPLQRLPGSPAACPLIRQWRIAGEPSGSGPEALGQRRPFAALSGTTHAPLRAQDSSCGACRIEAAGLKPRRALPATERRRGAASAAALPSSIEAAKAAAAEEAARFAAAAELRCEESDSDEEDVNDEVLLEALGFARYAASTRDLVLHNRM